MWYNIVTKEVDKKLGIKTVTKGPEYDQYMQMATMDYMEQLELGGEVDEEFEKEIEEFVKGE